MPDNAQGAEQLLTLSQRTVSTFLKIASGRKKRECMIIKRDFYLNKLIKKQNNGLIKIITGIRRCRKSFLLFKLFKEHLINNNVKVDHIIENAVYNELISRGYSVDVSVVEVNKKSGDGKNIRKQLEVNFVANLGSQRYYIQVAHDISSEEKQDPEYNSLRKIPDSFKKLYL